MKIVDDQYVAGGDALPPLVTPADVETLTGGTVLADDPRTPLLLAGASAAIRRAAGWHIAPVIEETITVAVPYGGGRLDVLLPSLRVRRVTSVRVDGKPVPQPEWTPDGHVWAGYLSHMAAPHTVEADVHHGFRADEVPDLAQVVAQVVAIAQSSPSGATREQAGALSVSWATTAPGVSGGLALLDRDLAVIDAYRLGSQP